MDSIALGFRKHLTLGDLDFIIACLSETPAQSEALLQLLSDPFTVDEILDHPRLLQTVLESTEHLQLSSRLYFYLLTRHSLKQSGLDDADLADYVSGILDQQLSHHRINGQTIFYLVDWLSKLERSPRERQFELYVRAGNYLLFLTGMFPAYLHERSRRRGAPGLDFYEDVGRCSFNSAAQHPKSQSSETHDIYRSIADHFSNLRYALNDVSERFMHMDNQTPYGLS
ncbi:hypothetical protein [Coraliomargarita parva]|uniref:hypothetical protein n=1 Tax=Coraliomargarita parva TaxID=3014050 RepID=UPI0022B5B7F9|nr:hypothetical protein [Coraliomargarita parva]